MQTNQKLSLQISEKGKFDEIVSVLTQKIKYAALHMKHCSSSEGFVYAVTSSISLDMNLKIEDAKLIYL